MTRDPLTALTDLDLERAVLGQVLTFNQFAEYEQAGLRAEVFAREEHGQIWQAAQHVADGGGEVDHLTVRSVLASRGQLERVGLPYLLHLGDGVPRPELPHRLAHLARLEELAAGRLAYYAAKTLDRALAQPGAVADGVLVEHLDAIQTIVERQRATQVPWYDATAQFWAHVQEVEDAATGARVQLGLPALDGTIGGIRRGEVCGLMGRPGMGKTILLSHVAQAMAPDVGGHVFFSLEMPASQIVARLKQMFYRVGRMTLEDRTRRADLDAGAYLAHFERLVIVDTPGLTVAEMGRRVRQIANGPLKGVPIRLITIDHLGLIGGDRALSTYDRVSVQAREIKELAKRIGCAVMLAVQVNREAGGDGSKELSLGSARDSGVVEEAMDYLIGIRRLDRSVSLTPFERARFRDAIFAKVIKNRHGEPGDRETAYRLDPVGLSLVEDGQLVADGDDVAGRIAQAGRRR